MIEALIAVFLDCGIRMRLSRLLLFVTLTAVSPAAFAGGPVVRAFSGDETSRFASAYWFRTDRGSVLVDAPFLVAEAEALKAAMRAGGALPLGAAILTGAQAWKSWGLSPLVSPATRVWGARSTATMLETQFHGEQERFLRSGIPLATMPRAAPRVTNTFTGSLNLGFEGYTLRLFEAGEAGTPATTVVFVPETGEMFTGGLVWNRVHPVTGGSDLGAWRRALSSLKRLGPRVVYPGYGEPGTAALIDRMSEYLRELEEAVRPLAFRSDVSAREIASIRKDFARTHRDWRLPSILDSSLETEHARLRGLLSGGE
jgi:glyoxylase-like metal-dependent hydrolase (beta-lactamase superfamily II)